MFDIPASFSIVAAAMALLAAATLALAMRNGRGLRKAPLARAEVERAVYRDQLTEIERDLARGTISPEDAKRADTEVSRRLLDTARSTPAPALTATASPLAAGLLALGVVGAAAWLYWDLGAPGYIDLPLQKRLEIAETTRQTRPSQSSAEAEVAALDLAPQTAANPDLEALVAQLREALQTRGDDETGLRLLARNEAALGHFVQAHQAQTRLIETKGAAATAQDYVQLADMMILAANGYVSPQAEDALTQALRRDPQNAAARYYSGLMFAQTGRPDLAFRLWEPLVTSSAPDAPWLAPIRARIEDLAAEAGLRYTLPPATPLAGPTAADIENAADLSDSDRSAMIEGMVESLSARLANSGGTAPEWAQLISALGVLGQTERARAIWQEAQSVFASDPAATATIATAARTAGVAP
ncbi:hypothetical protein AQS8620_01673 [Aquimixticola soesokkakensis]|uniref:Cytochrome c-type biogenesis protein CcmH n=1 Tax=Aquimixticola soesokkakensis TaxID=1519096 RepID=A0A1Y5SPA0_9RHOB|nr:c-type cytochrome biogenesis protein CcmI [Aquimixticola soesokkakensis]SLN42197.1 hypothetical protein AQS8620_01673 [Aquimixticola soesokkakensis]